MFRPPVLKENKKASLIVYPKTTARDVIAVFGQAMKKYPITSFVAVASVVANSIFSLIVPLYYKKFFDVITTVQDKAAAVPELINILLLALLFNFLVWLTWRTNGFAQIYLNSSIMADLRNRAFEYMLGHSYSFFSNNFTGSLTQRINRLSRAFDHLADRIIYNVLPLIIRLVGVLLVFWVINPIICVILLVWLVIFLVFSYVLAKWKLKYDIASAESDSAITAALSDSISNHNVVQLFSAQKKELGIFKKVNDEWKNLTAFRWTVDNVVYAVQSGLFILIEFILFYYSLKYWEQGVVTVGVFVLIQSYFISLGEQLWGIGRVVRDIYEGFADSKEMVEIMKLEHAVRDVPNAGVLAVSKGAIEFKNVVFGFNPTRAVISDMNLSVAGGEKVALVGPSGAGKSTIVRLLLRLYDVASGEIFIDGQNIAHFTQNSLRENISLVPQDPILFHRTLMENIRYGKPDATDEEVIRAAKLAHCDEFVDVLPKKYDTYVGERGVKLSGGERQRVAIARAILKNAPILVLDEATSSLDSHSEAMIQDALDVLMKGKTVVVIAHRLSTIRKMDRIVVVQDGNVLEQGTHEALIEKSGGLYAKLWSLQAGGFLKELGEEDEVEEKKEAGEEGGEEDE